MTKREALNYLEKEYRRIREEFPAPNQYSDRCESRHKAREYLMQQGFSSNQIFHFVKLVTDKFEKELHRDIMRSKEESK